MPHHTHVSLSLATGAFGDFGAHLFQTFNKFHDSTSFKVLNSGQIAFIVCCGLWLFFPDYIIRSFFLTPFNIKILIEGNNSQIIFLSY